MSFRLSQSVSKIEFERLIYFIIIVNITFPNPVRAQKQCRDFCIRGINATAFLVLLNQLSTHAHILVKMIFFCFKESKYYLFNNSKFLFMDTYTVTPIISTCYN